MQLGFPRHVCEAALAANKGDINESIDWLLTFGSEYGVSPTATSSSHASDIRVTYGDSDLELVRWCMNTILGRGFTGERPGSGGKLTAFSLLFETAAYIHDTAAAEAFDHESFWGDLMRIYMQLKFGTQSPALSAEEMSPGFDLRHVRAMRVVVWSLHTPYNRAAGQE